MSTSTSTSKYSWGTHTIYWVEGRKVAFRDTYKDGTSDIWNWATNAEMTEAELDRLLAPVEA